MRYATKRLSLVAVLMVVTGCAIDASSPVERIEPDPRYWFGPVTHEIVCRCTCESDSTTDQSPETHALPQNGSCETLDNAQCQVAGSGGFGLLKNCFKKSVRIQD